MRHITIILIFIVTTAFGQNYKIDSLLAKLHDYKTDDTIKADLLHRTGFSYSTVNVDSITYFAEKLKELSLKLGYSKGMVNYYNLLGIYNDSQGKYDMAAEYYTKSLELAKKINYQPGLSSAYNNLGLIYEILGNYPQALDYYQKSMIIDEKLKDSSGIANSIMQIGGIYEYQGDTLKALDCYRKSNEVALKINDKVLVIYSLLNIGYVLVDLDNIHQAYKAFDEAYHMSYSLGEKEGMLLSAMMLGILNMNIGNFDEAESYFNRSLDLCFEIGSKTHEKYCYYNIAELFFKKGDYKKAYEQVSKVYNENTEVRDEILAISSTKLLSKIYEKRDDYKEAYKYHVLYAKLKDSVFSKENIKRISDIENKYFYEKEKQLIEMEKQQIIALNELEFKKQRILMVSLIMGTVFLIFIIVFVLRSNIHKRKANVELNDQKLKIQKFADDLNTANITKDKFFSIIAHDLRGPFGTIDSLIHSLIENYDAITDEDKFRILVSAGKASKNTYNLLMNLLTWSRSQRGKIIFNPQNFEVRNTINHIVSLVDENAKKKNQKIELTLSKDISVINDKSMFEFVIRNLLSNAVKFTPYGGKIEIRVDNSEKGKVNISVVDNGIGMPDNMIGKLFEIDNNGQRKGTENEYGTGLGLLLCKEFANKMGGDISAISEEGDGSSFSFIIPVNQADNFKL